MYLKITKSFRVQNNLHSNTLKKEKPRMSTKRSRFEAVIGSISFHFPLNLKTLTTIQYRLLTS